MKHKSLNQWKAVQPARYECLEKIQIEKSIQNFAYKNPTKCNVIRNEQEINEDKSSIF